MKKEGKKNKICLIGYGGTIVMVVHDNKVQPAENVEEIFSLVPRIKEIAEIDLKILSNVDSTNVLPSDWEKMADFMAKNRDKYDGFLIAHGTNTMSYSASALSLALGRGFGKPVVLTGSQLPLTVYGNDGMFNLENSVKVLDKAIDDKISEVMVVFSDLILRGSRTVKVSESEFRAFDSPAYEHIGKILATGIWFAKSIVNYRDESLEFKLANKFANGTFTIDLSPGQNADVLENLVKDTKFKGLVLKSHGAGSVPTIGVFSYLPFIRRMSQIYKLPVLVATKFLGGNSYKATNDEPAIEAIEAGAIPTKDMTDVMSEVKLMWILGQGITDLEEIKKMVHTDFVGEISE